MAVILTVASGSEEGLRFELRKGERRLVGRVKSCDFRINDEEVSRRHCVLTFDATGIEVEDLGSANGTWINGARIGGKARLQPGDGLALGDVAMTVAMLPDEEDDSIPTVIVSESRRKRAPGDASPSPPARKPLPAIDPQATETSPEVKAGKEDAACLRCGRSISLATFASGEVLEMRGRFVCPQCRSSAAEQRLAEVHIPGYTIKGILGKGGMGAVFEGQHAQLEREVAIKVLSLQRATVKRHVDRFLREGRVLAALDHPNIVRVHDLGSAGDTLYIVMELVRGESLDQRIQREGTLTIRESCRIAVEILRALEYAFPRKIVHRDIKPQNVLIGQDESVKLADFGFAKSYEDSELSGITAPGVSVGTLAYMAPEQVRDSRSVDFRADIYAVGAVLFVSLTGLHFLPRASTTKECMSNILHIEAADLKAVRPEVPGPVCEAVGRALAKEPAGRFDDPSEMRRLLEPFVT